MAPGSRIVLTRHAQAEHNVDCDYSSESIIETASLKVELTLE